MYKLPDDIQNKILNYKDELEYSDKFNNILNKYKKLVDSIYKYECYEYHKIFGYFYFPEYNLNTYKEKYKQVEKDLLILRRHMKNVIPYGTGEYNTLMRYDYMCKRCCLIFNIQHMNHFSLYIDSEIGKEYISICGDCLDELEIRLNTNIYICPFLGCTNILKFTENLDLHTCDSNIYCLSKKTNTVYNYWRCDDCNLDICQECMDIYKNKNKIELKKDFYEYNKYGKYDKISIDIIKEFIKEY